MNEGMPEDDNKKPDQIPLLRDIVFDESLPLRPPPRPRNQRAIKYVSEHGPDYDPDTLDLFKKSPANEPGVQAEADQALENLAQEYSQEVTDRLREDLCQQLQDIVDDLQDDPEA